MRRYLTRFSPPLLALLGLLLVINAAAASQLKTSPRLAPSWRTGTTDYVVYCPQRHLALRGRASSSFTIDGVDFDKGPFRLRRPLAPGQALTISERRSDGQQTTAKIRCLPDDFPRYRSTVHGPRQAAFYLIDPTFGLAESRYNVIFDNRGTPIWWLKAKTEPLGSTLLGDKIAFARYFGGAFASDRRSAYAVVDFDGRLLKVIRGIGVIADYHDLQQLSNGHYLIPAYVPRLGVDLSRWGGPRKARVLDAVIQELDDRGRLIWSWNSKDHINLNESGPWMSNEVLPKHAYLADGKPAYDLIHINSIEPDGNGLIISARHLNAVFRISRPNGEVEWKIGGAASPHSLDIWSQQKEDHGILGGQHDARRLADSSLTVHDNGTWAGRPPRALRFRLGLGQASVVDTVKDGNVFTSQCCGSSRRLPGGNWVISWGGFPRIAEYTSSGRPLLTIDLPDITVSYRAMPVLAGQLSRDVLVRAMDRRSP